MYRGKLSEPEVTAIIKVIIIDKLSVEAEEVTYNTSFQNDLGADSLDVVELIMEFERVFDITIPDDEAERFTTVGDAIRYISPILGRR
ncbi:MAG: acyl carrier protein [Parabacteroides sp.]